MPRRLRLAVAPLVLLIAALTACAEPTRLPPPEEPAARAPLFASDEEALAAATEAYEEYLAVSNAILRDGGREPERLMGLVSSRVFDVENEGYALLRDNGWRATGSIVLVQATLQQAINNDDGSADTITYVCTSVAEADIVDSSGVPQTDPSRQTLLAHEVVIRFSDLEAFTIEEKSQWDSQSACA